MSPWFLVGCQLTHPSWDIGLMGQRIFLYISVSSKIKINFISDELTGEHFLRHRKFLVYQQTRLDNQAHSSQGNRSCSRIVNLLFEGQALKFLFLKVEIQFGPLTFILTYITFCIT